jgi:hypothetical protein
MTAPAEGPQSSSSPSSSSSSSDAICFARRLLPLATTVLHRVPEGERAPILIALDSFLSAPAPASFLAATRVMDGALRGLLIARAGAGPIRRGFADALRSLRDVGALPPAVVDELERGSTLDPRSIDRLNALSALVGAYAALDARVTADVDQHRRRWKTPPRPRQRQPQRKRKRR